MSHINGVLFDVGGVLVDLDGVPSLARHLGVEPAHDDLHRRWMACPSVKLHETGQLTIDEFAVRLVGELRLPLRPDAFVEEFAGWLTAPIPRAVELVNTIPRCYRVGVLSNMSAFHWHRIVEMGLPERFDFQCVSFETGLLKPSAAAFEHALARMALPAREVLFLDDGLANIEAAQALGMAARVVRDTSQIERALREHCVL